MGGGPTARTQGSDDRWVPHFLFVKVQHGSSFSVKARFVKLLIQRRLRPWYSKVCTGEQHLDLGRRTATFLRCISPETRSRGVWQQCCVNAAPKWG